jgi:adiponectin receptor
MSGSTNPHPSFGVLGRPRTPSQSYFDAAKSIWHLHDEAFNIWSHLLAAIWFTAVTIKFVFVCTGPPTRNTWAILVYLIAATLCFSWSALYHTLANHSQAELWQRIDHFGIAILIWASSSVFVFFSFSKHRTAQQFYITAVTLLALLSISQLWSDAKHSSEISWNRISWNRTSIHAIYGALSTLPAVHYAARSDSWRLIKEQRLLRSFCVLVLLNTLGGAIYVTSFVERALGARVSPPGIGHHVMHVLAVLGTSLYKRGIFSFYADEVGRAIKDPKVF